MVLPGQRKPRGTPQPADTSPQPGDEAIPEPPSQKITNKGALFSGLDKVTGRIITFDAAIGETVMRSSRSTRSPCRARSSASSPAGCSQRARACTQSNIPSTDVWLTDCKNPVVAVAAPPPEAAAPVTPEKPPLAPRRGTQPQTAPQPGAPRR